MLRRPLLVLTFGCLTAPLHAQDAIDVRSPRQIADSVEVAALARESGRITRPVSGYAKGVDYVFGRSARKPNHACVALQLDGQWRLVDPTWGAGVINGSTFEPRFTWDYFLVAPEQLILSHFPEGTDGSC